MCDTHSDESKSDPRSSLPELEGKIPAIHVSHYVAARAFDPLAGALTILKEILHRTWHTAWYKDNISIVSLGLSMHELHDVYLNSIKENCYRTYICHEVNGSPPKTSLWTYLIQLHLP